MESTLQQSDRYGRQNNILCSPHKATASPTVTRIPHITVLIIRDSVDYKMLLDTSSPKEASETQRLDKSHDEQSIIDFSKAFFTVYHLHEVLQKKFSITDVHKKTFTLGNLLFKRRPKRDKLNSKHMVYSAPFSEQPDHCICKPKRKRITKVQEHDKIL